MILLGGTKGFLGDNVPRGWCFFRDTFFWIQKAFRGIQNFLGDAKNFLGDTKNFFVETLLSSEKRKNVVKNPKTSEISK